MSDQAAATALDRGPSSVLSIPIEGLRTILQGLWACRVSLLSLVAGGYVLASVPQAHDLFVELHTGDVGRAHWALFFASVLFFWMLPVHLSARLMLEAHAQSHPTEFTSRGSRIVSALPWLLSLLCLVAVALAILAAKRNIPKVEANAPEQVRNLLQAAIDQVDTLLYVTGGLAVAFLIVWGLIYPLLLRLTRNSGLLDSWLVRKVSELLFDRERVLRTGETLTAEEQLELRRTMTHRRQIAVAAILLFVLWLASCSFVLWRPLDVPSALRRAPMLPIVCGAWVPVLTLPAYLATRWRLPVLAFVIVGLSLLGTFGRDYHSVRLLQDKLASNTGLAGVCFPDHRAESVRSANAPVTTARQLGLEQAIEMWRQANGCPYGQPCKKRPIVVAAEGGASRAAFFTASVLGYLQDTSPVASSGRTELSQQMFAISSVSGGALGAAAFVAALDDTGHTKAGPPQTRTSVLDTSEKRSETLWFRNRTAGSEEPMQTVNFGATVQPALRNPLQVVLSGDFLTPVAAGLGLDVWWRLHCEDRAAILERSWERRFASVVPPAASTQDAPSKAPDLSTSERNDPTHGMARPLSSFVPTPDRWRPLLIFNGSSVSTGRRIVTSTLHPLTRKPMGPLSTRGDAASSATPGATPGATRGVPEFEPVFGDTYDFYDHLCRSATVAPGATCQCVGGKTPDRHIKGCDIRLSTAVTNSARFPIITPHGDIRDPSGTVHDRIVDGGYFDNFGVLSATELATQLRAFDERIAADKGIGAAHDTLNPFILLISNDPEFNPSACPLARAAEPNGEGRDHRSRYNQARFSRSEAEYETRAAPDPPKDQGSVAFSMLRYPMAAALRSWTASARTAPTRLSLLPSTQYGFGIVQVCPQYLAQDEIKRVSMNWWLSMPVQAFLDSQICGTHNDLEMRAVAALLQGKSDKDADWETWVRDWQRTRVLTCDRRARPNRSVTYAPGAQMKK